MLRFLDGGNGVKSVAKDTHVHMWVNKSSQGLQSVHMLSPSELTGRGAYWEGSHPALGVRSAQLLTCAVRTISALAPPHFWLESDKENVER